MLPQGFGSIEKIRYLRIYTVGIRTSANNQLYLSILPAYGIIMGMRCYVSVYIMYLMVISIFRLGIIFFSPPCLNSAISMLCVLLYMQIKVTPIISYTICPNF